MPNCCKKQFPCIAFAPILLWILQVTLLWILQVRGRLRSPRKLHTEGVSKEEVRKTKDTVFIRQKPANQSPAFPAENKRAKSMLCAVLAGASQNALYFLWPQRFCERHHVGKVMAESYQNSSFLREEANNPAISERKNTGDPNLPQTEKPFHYT